MSQSRNDTIILELLWCKDMSERQKLLQIEVCLLMFNNFKLQQVVLVHKPFFTLWWKQTI